jgi:hypothetical protein
MWCMQALKGLKGRLWEMHQYLEAVTAGKMPVNRDIVALMQDIFNLLPNLNIQRLSQALTGELLPPHASLSHACPHSAEQFSP